MIGRWPCLLRARPSRAQGQVLPTWVQLLVELRHPRPAALPVHIEQSLDLMEMLQGRRLDPTLLFLLEISRQNPLAAVGSLVEIIQRHFLGSICRSYWQHESPMEVHVKWAFSG